MLLGWESETILPTRVGIFSVCAALSEARMAVDAAILNCILTGWTWKLRLKLNLEAKV